MPSGSTAQTPDNELRIYFFGYPLSPWYNEDVPTGQAN